VKRIALVFSLTFFMATLFSSRLDAQRPPVKRTATPHRVKMIIFADFWEPYCKTFFQTTYKTIKQTYGDKVEFELKHFPSHQQPGAIVASEAVYCAADQGKLWPYAEAVAASPGEPDKDFLVRTAGELGLNKETFSQCLTSHKRRARVDKDIHESVRLGLRGVPSSFIDGEFLEGALPFNDFKTVLDKHLQTTTRQPIKIDIVYDESFKLDDPRKYYSFLKTYYFPESEMSLVSHRSAQGRKLLKEFGVRGLPAFIISRQAENSPQFEYFKKMLEQKGNAYLLRPDVYEGITEYFEPPTYAGDPMLGNAKARVTIMEFSDFQCPVCGEFSRTTLPKLKQKYLANGAVKFVFRNYPLVRIHNQAEQAAIAGECAHRAGIFWKYHDVLFQNQKKLDRDSLAKYARELGQDPSTFLECLSSSEAHEAVQKDMEDGARLGINSTPTLMVNNFKVSGSDAQLVTKLIDYVIARQQPKTKGIVQ
jgi:protein-disulfide isomerase